MNEIFIPSSKKIIEVFGGDKCYQVPPYQRPYSWETEHVEELWDDIYDAFETGFSEYFLGSIILTRNSNSKFLDVIDGQQRLTTLTILFCVLRDLYFKDHNDGSKRKRIVGRIKNIENDLERLKFMTQIQHQNKFEQEILNGINFSRDIKDCKVDKFFNTACVFREKVNSLKNNLNLLEEFTEYLLENVRVVIIECTNQSFAMKLFQVLNNRGMELTPADLIKSYLMSKLEGEANFSVFQQSWIDVENKAKNLGESLTDLFTYYEYYLLGSNPKRSLYDELEKQFKNKEPKDVIFEFNKMVDYFDQIINQKSKMIYSLFYLKHDTYWKAILLTAKLKGWTEIDFNKLVKHLSKFYYLYWMSDFTRTKVKHTSFNIINMIKQGSSVDNVVEEIDRKISSDKVVIRALKNLKDENVYDTAWFKPLLLLVEYQQTDESNINFIDLEKSLHVEHILPRAHSKISYWTERFSYEDAEKLVNSAGNLTLLSGKKNIEASNKSFSDKIEIYGGKGIDGVTGFRSTQYVYDECKDDLEWNALKINNRRDWLFNEISKLLDVDVNQEVLEEEEVSVNVEELIKALNSFVVKDDVIVETKKMYTAYKVGKANFLAYVVYGYGLKLYFSVSSLEDPKHLVRDVSNIGHWATGNYEYILSSVSDLDYVLPLIQKAYEECKVVDDDVDLIDKVKDPACISYFNKLNEAIISLGAESHFTKYRLVYCAKRNFCSIAFRKDFLRIALLVNVNPADYPDLEFYVEDEEKWDYLKVNANTPLESLMKVVKLAYENGC